MKLVLSTLNAKYIHSALALYCLKSSLKAAGFAAEIKEYSINQHLPEILADLFRQKPDVLGLACYIWNREEILRLARAVKAVLPQCRIVLGGPEATYDAAALLTDYDWIDYVICGEGEECMVRLMQSLRQGNAGKDISGIAVRNNGEIVNAEAQVVENLDRLPFPYTQDDLERLQGKIIYYETSRGCPYSCQYCLSSATQGVRFRSFARVKEEIDVFLARGLRQIKLVDRTFNARPSHYQPIWRYLAQAGGKTLFHFEIAADILQEEDLEFLATLAPGKFQLEIGVQSTHPQTLTAIKRQNDWGKLSSNVRRLRKNGNMHLHLDLIAGLPYEDYETFGNSFNEVYALQPHMLQLGFLKLLPGSGIRKSAQEQQYVFLACPPYEVLGNHWIGYEKLLVLKEIEDVLERFYNSGLFGHTLSHLIMKTEKGAFAFYEKLARYWSEHGLQMLAHSTKGRGEILLQFIRCEYGAEKEVLEQLLKLDLMLLPKGVVRIAGLAWDGEQWGDEKTAFWRDEALVRRYFPQYKPLSWRELKKRYQMEEMAIDVGAYLKNGEIIRKRQMIIVENEGRAPVLHVLPENEEEQ